MGCRVTLGDICSFDRGASIPRTRMLDSGDLLYIHYGDLYKGFDLRIDVEKPAKPLPFISADEKIKDSQRLNDQDIVYVLTSETVDDLGHAYLFNNPSGKSAVSGTETTIVRVERKDVVLPAYLNYLMSSPKFISELRQYTRGMKVFRVHPNDVARIEVDLPSIDEQRKIVAILDAIYEKQQTNTKLNGYLLEAAKALLTEKVYTEKPYGTTTVREFVKSMTNGATPSRKKDEYWNDGTIPWVKTGEVNNNLIFETSEHVTELALEKTSIRLLPKDTLVMALYGSGTAGRLALLKTPATTNQACTAMVCNSAVESFYLFLTLQGMYREIDSLTRGSVQQNLSKDIVADLEIPNVTEEALEAFNLKRFYDLIALNEQGSLYLAELRDALLPKLMSGEIDVSKVDLTQLNSHLA